MARVRASPNGQPQHTDSQGTLAGGQPSQSRARRRRRADSDLGSVPDPATAESTPAAGGGPAEDGVPAPTPGATPGAQLAPCKGFVWSCTCTMGELGLTDGDVGKLDADGLLDLARHAHGHGLLGVLVE